jgi:membrane protease YdiL (CAAX protease family)
LIASSWWAAIHLQYDMFQIGILLAFGLFLGAARAKTESTLVPIAIHALMNLIATVEAHLSM